MEIKDILESMKGPHKRNYTPKITRWIWTALIVIMIAVGIKTSIYTIPTDSAGVVRQFGEYNRTTEPGIHLMLPFWIEIAVDVPVKKVQKEEFGFRTLQAGVDSRYLGVDEIDSGRLSSDDLITLIRESGERTSRSGGRQLAVKAKDILKGEYIKQFRADVLVMGDDWCGRFDHFNSLCEVVYLPRTPAISTTEVIERIRY